MEISNPLRSDRSRRHWRSPTIQNIARTARRGPPCRPISPIKYPGTVFQGFSDRGRTRYGANRCTASIISSCPGPPARLAPVRPRVPDQNLLAVRPWCARSRRPAPSRRSLLLVDRTGCPCCPHTESSRPCPPPAPDKTRRPPRPRDTSSVLPSRSRYPFQTTRRRRWDRGRASASARARRRPRRRPRARGRRRRGGVVGVVLHL